MCSSLSCGCSPCLKNRTERKVGHLLFGWSRHPLALHDRAFSNPSSRTRPAFFFPRENGRGCSRLLTRHCGRQAFAGFQTDRGSAAQVVPVPMRRPWVPAFAGKTGGVGQYPSVIPAKAGTQRHQLATRTPTATASMVEADVTTEWTLLSEPQSPFAGRDRHEGPSAPVALSVSWNV